MSAPAPLATGDPAASAPPPPSSRRVSWTVVALGTVLRAPVVAVAPVLGPIGDDLGVPVASAALLVSLPVLCFGLSAVGASRLIRRVGVATALAVSMALVAVGLVVRVGGGWTTAVVGTVLLGAAITVANVAVPLVTLTRGERGGRRMTTAYVVVMNTCTLGATVVTGPLAALVGWRFAVTVPSLVAAVALGVLLSLPSVRRGLPRAEAVPSVPRRPSGVRRRATARPGRPGRSRAGLVAGLLTLSFAGQTFGYYGTTAWLPTQLADELGTDLVGSGLSAAVFQAGGVVGPLLAALLLGRARSEWAFAVVGVLWIAFPLGMVSAPQAWWVWSVLAGVAQGATFTAVLVVVVRVSPHAGVTRRVSALVQGGGYAAGAAGPVAIGLVHAATGGWSWPMGVVVASVVTLAVAGVAASRLAGQAVGDAVPDGSDGSAAPGRPVGTTPSRERTMSWRR
ncbi:MFS transporter [Litorihabitans aurantiacus]|uniref:MFS transporter n=1 Tax=Litorihabitans aurantiacus TaxID=1930061 RepID=A0AA37XHG8_9MICO|nr:MFS transporter [Litorihabitans aurantiacus]GMA33156.1 MFS transporter [Litorihabitans aurantiacus]